MNIRCNIMFDKMMPLNYLQFAFLRFQLCLVFAATNRNCQSKFSEILFCFVSIWYDLICLHIRSMWETICDAKASRKRQGKIFAQIPQNTLFWKLVQKPPPPPKLKLRQILALWILTSRTTPPLSFRCVFKMYTNQSKSQQSKNGNS